MKKLLLFFFAALIVSTGAQSQDLRIGFKGGANYSNLSGDLGVDNVYNSKLGLHGGVMLNFALITDFLSIQPEILYSNKGYSFDETPYSSPLYTYRTEGRVNYNYIDVPVLLRVKAGPLFFELGPQASYLINVKNDYRETRTILGGATGTTREFTDSDKSGLTRFEVGYAAGLGFQTDNGVMLGGRYTGDLSRFATDVSYYDGELRLDNARHSVFQLYLGFLLP